MTEESIRQQSYNDELIKLQLSNISLNARPKVERRAPMKPIVTQQQIDDYRRKMSKPIRVDGVNYKYSNSESEPILEDVDDTIIQEVLTEEQLAEGRNDLIEFTKLANGYQEEILKIEKEKQDFIYNVNNVPEYTTKKNIVKELEQQKKDIEKEIQSKQKLIIELKKNTKDSIKNSKKIEEERDNINILRKEIEDINDEIIRSKSNVELDEDEIVAVIKNFDDEIENQRKAYEEVEKYIVQIQNIFRRQDEAKSINQAEEQRVKEINKGRVKNYQNELNQLNRGEFSIVQQGNETEQEWLERLNEFGKTLYDDEKLNLESNIYNIKELRKNLKELIKDDVIIDDVIRAFNVVEEDVYQLNTIFNPYIKNKFIKLYGKFNPRITFDNVSNLLSDLLY